MAGFTFESTKVTVGAQSFPNAATFVAAVGDGLSYQGPWTRERAEAARRRQTTEAGVAWTEAEAAALTAQVEAEEGCKVTAW